MSKKHQKDKRKVRVVKALTYPVKHRMVVSPPNTKDEECKTSPVTR